MIPDNFICPDCGSSEISEIELIDDPDDGSDPWNATMEAHRCRQCRSLIPAHLGERWQNRTLEQAQREWREFYRETQPRQD